MSAKQNPFLIFAATAILILGISLPASAQILYRNVKSLVAEGLPASPTTLIEGNDGALYGASIAGGNGGYGTIYKINKDGSDLKVLKSFSSPATGGRGSYGLLKGTNGALYGVCYGGGSNDLGTIFIIHQDGNGFSVLHHFGGGTDGGTPYGSLIHGSNAVLFGTTYNGGISNKGTVFRINQDGTGYAVLHHFTGANGEGANPSAGLTLGTNGVLYGATQSGGDFFSGTLFKLNQDGSGYSMFKKFSRSDGGGWRPGSSLVQGADGRLYGMTMQGTGNSYAVVFGINLDGSGYGVVKSFTDTNPAPGFPVEGGLMQGTNGALYITAESIGSYTAGIVFKVNPDGTGFAVLKVFSEGDVSGSRPRAVLCQASDGWMYGTTWNGGASSQGVVFRITNDGSNYSIIKHFSSGGGDAQIPSAPVLLASDEALYGTTRYGGVAHRGTIFKVNPDGSGYELLRSFTGTNGDGSSPLTGLIEGTDGALYGTTIGGGTNTFGCVYKINKDGTSFAVLKSFTSASQDPSQLVLGPDGALYGTTFLGGVSNLGTIYTLKQDGSGYTVLKNFTGNGNGSYPTASLMVGQDGALYGTAAGGGSGNQGFIFRINIDGTGFTILKSGSFSSCLSPLVQGTDGTIYGTAGNLFKLNPDGSGFAVIKGFPPNSLNGEKPYGVTIGLDGTFYGVCSRGGSNNFGTIFKIRPDGSGFSVLKSFTGNNGEGIYPEAPLIRSNDGTLYGTTRNGGETGYGSVFSVAPAVAISKPMPINGKLHLSMTTGISGRIYTVQRSGSLAGPWSSIGTVTADTSGLIQYQDPNPPEGAAFYRTVYP